LHEKGTVVELPEETVADLTKRLRRAEGQVRGVQQMLAEGRDCREIVAQLSAASKAIEQAGFLLVAAGLTWCVEDPERALADGYAVADVQKMFMKLA
jgi:DNA-binding FrmR family transcriptional regulator